MEVLVVAADDAALLDHLRGVVYSAIEASGLPVEVAMALSDTPEERLGDQRMLLWRDRRCHSGLAAFLANDPSSQPEQLLPSASVDSLAPLPNNDTSDSATAAAATAAMLKRVHKRDRKIKTLTATVDELRAQLADALARATFVEQEQEQFFQDVQHMKEAFNKLHASHQKLLWEYLPSKDPDLRAIPRLSRELEASESRVGPYELGDVLGYGQYATVFEAQESPEHEPLAVKAIDKEKLVDLVTLHRVNSEIATLQDPAIRDAGILALRHVFHTPRYIFLVTERGGKDLFEFFGPREQGVPEETVCTLVRRVALAVETLHRHNYCHRDLKPENILYDPDHASPAHAVKLVDFGLCTRATSPQDAMLHDFCGSPGFFAPEILLSAQYDGQKADVWSLGCILLELVLGNDRFAAMWMAMYELETLRDHDKFRTLVHSSLEAARAYCHSAAWTYSPSLRGLLLSLLAENPPARPSVAQLLDHAWFHDAASSPPGMLRACSSPRGLSPTRVAKTTVLPSPASFCNSHLPIDTAAIAGTTRRPASAENDQSDHGSPHISVLLAAAAPAVESSSSSPSKTHKNAAPSDHAPAKLSLPSLSPEKPSGARSPDKTFAKRAATATSSMLPASNSHSHSHTSAPSNSHSHSTGGAHTLPTRSSSRYDDDDDHAHS